MDRFSKHLQTVYFSTDSFHVHSLYAIINHYPFRLYLFRFVPHLTILSFLRYILVSLAGKDNISLPFLFLSVTQG